ncbi:ABC transporter ATP-binding protein [Autumnicola musiva]|uniref:ABC transporter ATP-binding protein n=1 Tax=Autumnicola musiva TaxID=3075589 RepID=A0ABU3D3H3_9FLAO|nr:ABC transporter ATP-binding protein [Zunongwangia sp. F117]MDT0675951.1 ABC transporter ATP-binding protein [Zunongwangia sp. F117]
MSYVTIQVEDLSKQYRLGVVGTGTLSHDLNRWWYKVRGKPDPYLKLTEINRHSQKAGGNYVWALKDINFQVEQGEVLGIIGSNGAGKSTLLKILSQVTAPTTGMFKARGRIASLLEVGTGFHHELTGRENIFLNGAILGMTKSEIKSKLDEIVSFSGVERYVDTPVKRYSSGMKVRLAFAVAAHLEPEILIVDEVLAVGDAAFQKKAIGKMQQVSHNSGRTVLFVSHNMGAVSRLCTRGLVLKEGSHYFDGSADEAVQEYANINLNSSEPEISLRNDRQGMGDFRFTSVRVENEALRPAEEIRTGSRVFIHTTLKSRQGGEPKKVYAAVCFRDALDNRLFTLSSSLFGKRISLEEETLLTFEIPRMPLSEGLYLCDLYIAEGRGDTLVQDYVRNAFKLKVFGNDFFDSGDPQPVGLDKFYTDFRIVKNQEKEIISSKI